EDQASAGSAGAEVVETEVVEVDVGDVNTEDENENEEEGEAESLGVFSNDEDRDTVYQDIGTSRVSDCPPNFQTLPNPSKLRGPSVHSPAITSHAAVATSSVTDDEPARKRTKTDMKKSLQIAVAAAFSKCDIIQSSNEEDY
ncbi:hypothetical protein MAM1_1111d11464, partial [Mucor ambiguus]